MANPRQKYTQASSLLAPNLAQFAIINNVGADRMAFYDSSAGTWTNLKANQNLEIVGTNLNVSFASAGFVTNGLLYWNGTDIVNSANATFDGTAMTIAGNAANSTLRVGYLESQGRTVNENILASNGYHNGTNLIYRATGYYSAWQFINGGVKLLTGASGTAGSIISYAEAFTVSQTGAGGFAGDVTATKFIGPVTALKSITTSIDVAAATSPSSGQVLTATSSTVATWQTPTLGTVPVPIAQGGTNATSFSATNGLVYYDGTRLVNDADATFDGTTMAISGSASDSTLRVGYLESQGRTVNENILSSNGYHNGTNLIYRATGFYSAWQFINGGVTLLTAPSGTGGSIISYTSALTISQAGNGVFAGTLAASNLSGTNSGNVTLAGENYLSIAGQVVTANAVTLSGTNVTGILPIAKGGTNASSFTANGVNYYDGTRLATSSNMTFDGTTLNIAGNGALSTLRVGTLEFQTLSADNGLVMRNGYDDGSDFRYRANGYFSGLQLFQGGVRFLTGASGTAGNIVAYSIPMEFDGTSLNIVANGSNSNLRVGWQEHQSLSVNESFIFNNGYDDGTNFRYRSAGYFVSWQFFNGGIRMVNAATTGAAGAIATYAIPFEISIGGEVTGAKFIGPVTALKSATTSIDVSAATAPSAGQVLTATSSTAASWASPAGTGTVTSVTSANAAATVATTTTTPVITIVYSPALKSASTTVDVSAATAPSSGQVLTATSSTTATWQGTTAKVYRALVTQSAASAPVATVLENSLGFTPTWTRTTTGVYTITSSAAWTADKTFCIIGQTSADTADSSLVDVVKTFYNSTSVIGVYTSINDVGSSYAFSDSVLYKTEFQILLYP